MKRILVLSLTLILGFAPVSFVYAQEEGANRPANPGEDPNEKTGRTFVKAGTEAGAGAIGVPNDCENCRLFNAPVTMHKNTNPGAKSQQDASGSSQSGTR